MVLNSVLFPLGHRLSTWVAVAVFLARGVRDRRYWLAAAAWLVGFEVAFQATETAEGIARSGFHPSAWWVPVVVFGAYACGIAFVWWVARRGIRPSIPILGAVAVLWVVWIATGFHVNTSHTMGGFDPAAEAINEGAKTLWALAYLVPLLRAPKRSGAGVEPT